MGNANCHVDNKTGADFYVVTFNDADLVNTTYALFHRVPAGQRHYLENPAAGDYIKVGVVFYMDATDIGAGFNKGDFDLWRVKNERDLTVTFIGDKRGAGLARANEHGYLGPKNYRFNPADSKAINS